MTNAEFLLDNHLKPLKFLGRYFGFSIESKRRSLKNKVKDLSMYLLNFFWLNTDLLGGMYWFGEGLAKGDSIVTLSYIVPCLTYAYMANCKGFFLLRYESEINDVIDSLKALEVNVNTRRTNKDKRRIIEQETKFLGIVITISNVVNVILVVTFALSPLILTVYEYLKTNVLDLKLPFPIAYPFDSHDIRFWPFVYIHQIWSNCIVEINVCAADYLFYISSTFLRIQFRLLDHSFENLLSVKNTSIEEIQSNFVELIKWHQTLIRLVEMLEMIFTKSTLVNFVASSVLICFTGFNVMAIQDMVFALTFFAFLSSCLLQIYLLCFFGDMLMRSSMEIGDAVYKSRWYEANPAVCKNLLLVHSRSQKPCRLTASGFADVNLRAFMKVLSTAWSYFALLKTMYGSPRTY